MEILLTGNTALVTQHWIEAAFPQDRVLLTTRQQNQKFSGIRTVQLNSRRRLEQLLHTDTFDRIVYFSETLTLHNEVEGELDRLCQVLEASRTRAVQLLYLTGPEGALAPPAGKTVLAQAAEQLCRQSAQNGSIQIKIVRMPYLYALETAQQGGGLDVLFAQALQGTLQLKELPQQPVFALCMEELAELTARIFDRWTPELEVITVPGVRDFTYEELGASLQQLCPGLQITYGTALLQQYPPDDGIVRRRYGWFAHFSLRDDLPSLWNAWQAVSRPPQGRLEKLFHSLRNQKAAGVLLEVFIVWLGTELLVRLTTTQAQFRMIDFRLLFVVLLSTVHGMNTGVLAAVLAAVSLVLGYLRQGTAPILLFYEPSYWLAFLSYFIAGAVCGYVQLRGMDQIRFAQEENKMLRQRLDLVQQLYQDALQEKRLLARQLLAQRDSFGKAYAVVRQLDAAQPELFCQNAVKILEDVLENHSAALYRPTEGGFSVQLAAASSAIAIQAEHALRHETLCTLRPILERGELWVNRRLQAGLPMYAAAARKDGRPILWIVLWDAREEQLTLAEENRFRILSGLIELSLDHTRQDEKAAWQEADV